MMYTLLSHIQCLIDHIFLGRTISAKFSRFLKVVDICLCLILSWVLFLFTLPNRPWLRKGEEHMVQRFDPVGPRDTIGFFIAKFSVAPH